MNSSAKLFSLQALDDLKGALSRFSGEAQEALVAAELDIRRALEWLQERLHHWQRAVEKWRREIQQAKIALKRCQRSGYYDQDGYYHAPDCSAYEAALATTRRRLQEAETELENTRKWLARVEEVVAAYRVEARRLQQLATNQTKRAQAFLARKRGDVERYVALSQRAALATVSATLVREIPLAYDRYKENSRKKGVRHAKKQEIELVRATERGTRKWTKAEIRNLKAGKFPSGKKYKGHHIYNVNHFPELAAYPDNIKFVTPKEHSQLHYRGTRKATSGKMYNRKSLMVQWAKHK
jgi:predicted  nucleic acid-binding Zn-ribbon protein